MFHFDGGMPEDRVPGARKADNGGIRLISSHRE